MDIQDLVLEFSHQLQKAEMLGSCSDGIMFLKEGIDIINLQSVIEKVMDWILKTDLVLDELKYRAETLGFRLPDPVLITTEINSGFLAISSPTTFLHSTSGLSLHVRISSIAVVDALGYVLSLMTNIYQLGDTLGHYNSRCGLGTEPDL